MRAAEGAPVMADDTPIKDTEDPRAGLGACRKPDGAGATGRGRGLPHVPVILIESYVTVGKRYE